MSDEDLNRTGQCGSYYTLQDFDRHVHCQLGSSELWTVPGVVLHSHSLITKPRMTVFFTERRALNFGQLLPNGAHTRTFQLRARHSTVRLVTVLHATSHNMRTSSHLCTLFLLGGITSRIIGRVIRIPYQLGPVPE